MQSVITHEPLSLPGRHKVGVLLIHGFTGSPWSMRPLAQFFTHRGYAVELPLLPGHGTRWNDMLETTRHQWLEEVDQAYWRLKNGGYEVVVVGLSMGGMLAFRESARRDVLGTILINPFVQDPTPLLRFASLASPFVVSIQGITSDISMPGVDEGGYDRLPLKSAGELYRLGRESRPVLSSLRAPVLYFRSKNDHIVSNSSHQYFLKEVTCPVEFIELESSYHVATLDYDAQLIFDRSLQFVEELAQGVEGSP